MIMVQMLEADDLIAPLDWCRPLSIVSMSGGHSDHYSFRSCYTGTPENNAKWVRVQAVIGECWFGKTIGEFTHAMRNCGPKYEFVRGEVPKGHRLSMKDYNDLSKMNAKAKRNRQEDFDDDIPF